MRDQDYVVVWSYTYQWAYRWWRSCLCIYILDRGKVEIMHGRASTTYVFGAVIVALAALSALASAVAALLLLSADLHRAEGYCQSTRQNGLLRERTVISS